MVKIDGFTCTQDKVLGECHTRDVIREKPMTSSIIIVRSPVISSCNLVCFDPKRRCVLSAINKEHGA